MNHCDHACPCCHYHEGVCLDPFLDKWQKAQVVLSAFRPFFKTPIPYPDTPWGMRRRSFLRCAYRAHLKEWVFGPIIEKQGTECLLPIPNCPIHHPSLNYAFKQLGQYLPHQWPLFGAFINRQQITLILKEHQKHRLKYQLPQPLWEKLRGQFDGLWINYNPAAGKRIFQSKAFHLMAGQSFSLDAQNLQYGPSTFLQVADGVHQNSLTEALLFFGNIQAKKVLDLYCGRGTSLLLWQAKGASCLGVESSDSADLAKKNGPSIPILRGTVTNRRPQIIDWEKQIFGPLFVYANPPRTGLAATELELILQLAPEKMAYLSCAPKTLCCDLENFVKAGWKVHSLRAYDFFPQTLHLEIQALLSRT
ncbi:MAG: hypothetical protein HYV97_09665 [Bdellovibrio sp.]|nr:hypothetical protein [Bdellovibrio sp.]